MSLAILREEASQASSLWIALAREDDIPRRTAHALRWQGVAIAIFRGASGTFYALEDSCPHKQGPLSEGLVHGERVTCPLHAWVFELGSGEATGADHGCTRSFPVKVSNGVVHVFLPKRQD